MLKKIIIGTLFSLLAVGVVVYFYVSLEINDTFPLMLDGTKDLYIESCESSVTCTEAINSYYSECASLYVIKKVTLFSFQEEYTKFVTSTHKCIQSKSGTILPGVWDYLAQQKLNG